MQTISVYVDEDFATWLRDHAHEAGESVARLGGEMLMHAGPHQEEHVAKLNRHGGSGRVTIPARMIAALNWGRAKAVMCARSGSYLTLRPLK